MSEAVRTSLKFAITRACTSAWGSPKSSARRVTVNFTEVGVAGEEPSLVNGPSVSVRIRSLGILITTARPFEDCIIAPFTEKK